VGRTKDEDNGKNENEDGPRTFYGLETWEALLMAIGNML
jgi:hypothetical protein